MNGLLFKNKKKSNTVFTGNSPNLGGCKEKQRARIKSRVEITEQERGRASLRDVPHH